MTVWLREEYKNITLYRYITKTTAAQCKAVLMFHHWWCGYGVKLKSSRDTQLRPQVWLNVKLLTIWTPDKCTCYSNSAVDVFVCCPLLANSEWWITPDPPNQFRTEALKLAHTHASGPDGSSCCCALCDLLVLSSYGETALISNFSSRI